jgi:PAS domain S-box-containing protein
MPDVVHQETSILVPALNRPLRILHLEDDPNDHRLIREWLAEKEFAAEFTVVDNQPDFIKALAAGTFDLVLSDKSLPRFDGLIALGIVKEKCNHIPFIFVTGSMGEEAAIETIKSGATDYVLKDRLGRLIPAVERALREFEQAEKARHAEEKIREQAALLDAAQEAILVKDVEDRILFWNKSAEKIYGWPAAEIIGRKEAELLSKNLPEYQEARHIVLENGTWSGELVKVNRAGNDLLVESRWTLVRGANGRPKSILSIDTDITGKKPLEAQLLRAQRLESIGAMASGIAHDLNNCLSPILMGVAVLKDLVPDPSVQNILSAMEASVTRGADVVRQVLTFARGATSARMVVQPNHLIQEVVKIILETFPRSIQIEVECDPNLWTIESDATQIHQILLNLCLNARDAMPDGGTLRLTSRNVRLADPSSLAGLSGVPGPYIRIDVKDTGTGIPAEIQQKIFEPFYTTKEVGKGTGLGLSTTVSILKSHRGLLGLQSAAGAGTTFSLFFPGNAATVEAEHPAELRPCRIAAQDLILLVDDEAAIREMCKFVLESYNYRVLSAENGAQALALLEQHKNELALAVIDSDMPVMGGPSTIRSLRQTIPDLKVISTSGREVSDEAARAPDPKLHRFLAKPYTAENLFRLISELLPKGDTQFFGKPEPSPNPQSRPSNAPL